VTLEDPRRWHFLYCIDGNNIHRIKRTFGGEFLPVIDVIGTKKESNLNSNTLSFEKTFGNTPSWENEWAVQLEQLLGNCNRS
jgi:hypothetical protein